MRRVPANHASQANHPGKPPRARQQFRRQRKLESAGHVMHLDAIFIDTQVLELSEAAFQQFANNRAIEARPDDSNARIAGNSNCRWSWNMRAHRFAKSRPWHGHLARVSDTRVRQYPDIRIS